MKILFTLVLLPVYQNILLENHTWYTAKLCFFPKKLNEFNQLITRKLYKVCIFFVLQLSRQPVKLALVPANCVWFHCDISSRLFHEKPASLEVGNKNGEKVFEFKIKLKRKCNLYEALEMEMIYRIFNLSITRRSVANLC